MRQNRHQNLGRYVLGTLVWAGAVSSLMGADAPREGTFFEEILTVQSDKGQTAPPDHAVVSIPYTRVDVAVDNGIAMTRVLQVYHNHSSSNQGFAFTMPLQPDTTITHFNLWDQGKRYAAAIEERVSAEQAYKQVTGEEAPTMNRDPGLVRQEHGRYEMRIFPILPAEDKQAELFSYRRLGMIDGEFVLTVPLAGITSPRDARHGSVQSAATDLSVLLRDEFPIEAVAVAGADLRETVVDAHSRLLKIRLQPGQAKDLEVRYRISAGPTPAVTSQVFSQDGARYFLLRLIAPAQAGQLPSLSATNQVFYMGVWHPGTVDLESEEEPRAFAMEFAAFTTLAVLRTQDQFHGSYWPPRFKDKDMPKGFWGTGLTTRKLYNAGDGGKALEESFVELDREGKSKAVPKVDTLQHLRDSLRGERCRLVYLFLGRLPSSATSALSKIVRQHRQTSFILVTDAEKLPAALGSEPNVSHFSLQDGWIAVRHAVPVAERQLLTAQEWSLADLIGGLGLTRDMLTRFWEKLPNLGDALPTLATKGDPRLRDVQTFTPQSGEATNGLSTIWLSGRCEGNGRLDFELTIPRGSVDPFRATNQLSRLVRASVVLDDTVRQSRLVGTFHARQMAEALDAQIAMLRQPAAGRRAVLAEREKEAERTKRLAALRQEVVRLSKTFSFISSETAFIALPPDLQKKYGFSAQQQAAQQYYTSVPSNPTILPEPATWQLVVAGAGVLYFVYRRRRHAYRHGNIVHRQH